MDVIKRIISVAALFTPFFVFADGATFDSIVARISGIASALIPVLITVALAYFIYGVVKFIGGGEEGRKQAKDIIVYGIIGLFAIVSVWGLVKLIQDSFGIKATTIDFPSYTFPGSR